MKWIHDWNGIISKGEPVKRIFAAVTVALFMSIGLVSAVSGQTTDLIQSIRQQYATINRGVAKYRKVKKELSGFSAEGGTLVAYFSGPAIMKIVATYYGEGGRTIEEYYYRDAQLIFVFRKELRYSRPLSGKVVSTKENRFYFSHDELIKWINESGKEVARGDEYTEEQSDCLKTSKLLTEGSRSKKATIEAPD